MHKILRLKAVVIEDNEEASEHLISMLSAGWNNIEVLGTAKGVSSGISLLSESSPDLVFMDIKLQDGSAFDILDRLPKTDFDVIFTTAYNEFLQRAIEHYAFYYLLKPFNAAKLEKVLEKYTADIHRRKLLTERDYVPLQTFVSQEDPRLLINTGKEHVFIKIAEVLKCEADGNYSFFYLTNSRKYHAYHSLKYFENLLTEKGFFRANRKLLVNLDFVKSIYKREALLLINGEKVTISTRNRSRLSQLIQDFT